MSVVSDLVCAANSGGVLCSGPSSRHTVHITSSLKQSEHFAPTELEPQRAIACYKHSIPTGFFVRLNSHRLCASQ